MSNITTSFFSNTFFDVAQAINAKQNVKDAVLHSHSEKRNLLDKFVDFIFKSLGYRNISETAEIAMAESVEKATESVRCYKTESGEKFLISKPIIHVDSGSSVPGIFILKQNNTSVELLKFDENQKKFIFIDSQNIVVLTGGETNIDDLEIVDPDNLGLSNVDLKESNFCGADLSGWDFSNVNLQDSNFCEAKLIGTKFFGSRLGGVDFMWSDLTNAILPLQEDVDYTAYGVKFYGAKISNLKDIEFKTSFNKYSVPISEWTSPYAIDWNSATLSEVQIESLKEKVNDAVSSFNHDFQLPQENDFEKALQPLKNPQDEEKNVPGEGTDEVLQQVPDGDCKDKINSDFIDRSKTPTENPQEAVTSDEGEEDTVLSSDSDFQLPSLSPQKNDFEVELKPLKKPQDKEKNVTRYYEKVLKEVSIGADVEVKQTVRLSQVPDTNEPSKADSKERRPKLISMYDFNLPETIILANKGDTEKLISEGVFLVFHPEGGRATLDEERRIKLIASMVKQLDGAYTLFNNQNPTVKLGDTETGFIGWRKYPGEEDMKIYLSSNKGSKEISSLREVFGGSSGPTGLEESRKVALELAGKSPYGQKSPVKDEEWQSHFYELSKFIVILQKILPTL